MLDRLTEAIAATGCPVVTVRVIAPGVGGFDPAPTATPAQVATAQAAVAAFDWSDAAESAWWLTKRRSAAEAVLDGHDDLRQGALRALALLVLDEVNRHATKWNDYKTQVASATSLADLKTRVAAMSDLPVYTAAQLVAAIKAKIAAGAAD